MVFLTWILLLFADEPGDSLAKKMLPIYRKEIAEYSMAVESAPKKKLEITKEPVFEWSNPVDAGGQQGVVFLWLRDGRPAALGCIFSEPEGRLKGRKVIHEFHALDREKLLVSRPSDVLNEWKPQAGLARQVLSDAAPPAATRGARLVQMRRLAQEFTGYEVGGAGKRLDLRLLPTPLYRYPAAKNGVVDGALFTLVSTSGTDPEVLLLIEAHEKDGKTRWEHALGRFSDRSVYVKYKDEEIWSLVRSETNTFLHDPQHLYRTYADKVVDLDGKLLARVRATERVWWGEFLPVNEKCSANRQRQPPGIMGETNMTALSLMLVLTAAGADDGLAKKMLPIYVKEASEYSMAVESAPKKALELKKKPVFEWSNPIRSGLQQGVVFLWLRDGRPAALASIFSQPDGKLPGRRIIHEFHALDTEKLLVSRSDALNEWKPQAGLARKEFADSEAPAATAGARLVQMRRLAREFTGHSINKEGQRWELRLLPAPLYRYPAAKSGMVDGALFTLVSTAGTDPEVLLLIEAREEGGKPRWQYACCRFSDRDLHVQRKDKEVWSSLRSETDTILHDSQHLYRLYGDKVVTLDGKLLARIRTTDRIWWGEVIPVDEK